MAEEQESTKNNHARVSKSGIKGVYFLRGAWEVSIWDVIKKKNISRSFSLKKYPDAKERAVAWHKAMEIKMNYRKPDDANELEQLETTRVPSLPNETWKPVRKFPMYEVSNMGRVKNAKSDFLLTPLIKQGYGFVLLRRNGRDHNRKIARLVALEFIQNPDPESFNVVDHIDRNKGNDKSSNLRWTDNEGNGRNQSINTRNKSGVIGVRLETNRGPPVWRATIIDQERIYRSKSFSTRKYRDAFDRAVDWRKQKEREYGYTSETASMRKRKREIEDSGDKISKQSRFG